MYNVMIADDENVIRKYIISFIDWESLDCKVIHESDNGLDAHEFLKNNAVDIVIVDIKMPGMGGIELAEYIHNNHPHTKVIILTAYSDFSYAQSALRHDVVDFIIKTKSDEKLIGAIGKAKKIIEQEKDMERKFNLLESKIKSSFFEISEKFIKDILDGILTIPDDIEKKSEELDLRIKNYFVVSFEINEEFSDISKFIPADHDKLIFAVRNFLSLALKRFEHCPVIINKHLLIVIVSFENDNKKSNLASLVVACNDIIKMVDKFMNFNISIGISDMYKKIQDLPKPYKESMEAVSWKFYSDTNVSIYVDNKQYNDLSFTSKKNDQAENIIIAVREGDCKKSISSLKKLINQMKADRQPVEDVKAQITLLCSQCFKLSNVPDLDNDEIYKNESHTYKLIKECQTIQSLYDIACDVVKSISDLMASYPGKQNYLVREVSKFIKANYNNNIGLKDISKSLHINSSYLSRLYKNETGESITDAVNKFKIEKAKRILENSSSKIYEVGYAIGIEDPAYFSHVFNKYTGKSPREYRDDFFNSNHPKDNN